MSELKGTLRKKTYKVKKVLHSKYVIFYIILSLCFKLGTIMHWTNLPR